MYNFGDIRSRNPRVYTVITVTPFAAIRQKWAYPTNISEYPRPILTYFTGLIGVLVGIIIQIFVWRSPKGRCCDNQLYLGDVCRRQERSLLFALAFDNELYDVKSISNRFNGSNPATSCTNLVNFNNDRIQI